MFIHDILYDLKIVEAHDKTTAGIRTLKSGLQFFYNPKYFFALTKPEQLAVCFHETLHVAMLHCTGRSLPTDLKVLIVDAQDQTAKHYNLANIAADLEINGLFVESSFLKRPKYAVTLDVVRKFPGLEKIPAGKTQEWYYHYMKENLKKDENDNIDLSGFQIEFGDHDNWEENTDQQAQISDSVNRALKSKTSWGSMSSGSEENITAAQVKKFPIDNVVKSFVGLQYSNINAFSYKKPNRKFGLGYPYISKQRIDAGLVACDTSGSTMSFLDQIGGLLNNLSNMYPIHFCCFDCELQTQPVEFRSRSSITFKGMGGTDFQPVIDLLEEGRYSWAVIITDGCAAPVEPPKKGNCAPENILWILPEDCEPPVSWGSIKHFQPL